jgi:hypothetical protein
MNIKSLSDSSSFINNKIVFNYQVSSCVYDSVGSFAQDDFSVVVVAIVFKLKIQLLNQQVGKCCMPKLFSVSNWHYNVLNILPN